MKNIIIPEINAIETTEEELNKLYDAGCGYADDLRGNMLLRKWKTQSDEDTFVVLWNGRYWDIGFMKKTRAFQIFHKFGKLLAVGIIR